MDKRPTAQLFFLNIALVSATFNEQLNDFKLSLSDGQQQGGILYFATRLVAGKQFNKAVKPDSIATCRGDRLHSFGTRSEFREAIHRSISVSLCEKVHATSNRKNPQG